MRGLKGAALLLCLAAPGWGAPRLSASGYLKDLWQYSRSALQDTPYFLNTSRARLTLDAKASLFAAHADYDHEALAGSFFRTAEYRLVGLGEPQAWLDMEQTISTGDTVLWRHRLYRGWAGLDWEEGVLRFGRQRIAWGTGKLWNPTDVLNPYVPVSIERDERRGVDAAYFRQALASLSQVELAYAPRDRWPQSALLARLKTNWKGADFSLMGGKVAASTGSCMAGGDFAANLREGTLHGEWSYTDPKIRTPYWRAGIGYDYTFTSDTKLPGLKDAAVVVEYFHNGAGVLDTARYDFSQLLTGREVALARNYAGLTFSKDLHPLVKFELAALANLDDKSHFVSPSLQWNALNNLYLTGGFQRFGGEKTDEFGRAPNIGFLQAQFYF